MTDTPFPGSLEMVRVEPGYSGSRGDQVPAPIPVAEVFGSGTGNVAPSHLGATLTTFADSRTVAVGMIAVAAYKDATERGSDSAEKLEKCREVSENLRRELAVLRDRESRTVKKRWYTEAALIFGGVIAGSGFPLLLAKDFAVGLVTLLAGSLLVLFGLGVNEPGADS